MSIPFFSGECFILFHHGWKPWNSGTADSLTHPFHPFHDSIASPVKHLKHVNMESGIVMKYPQLRSFGWNRQQNWERRVGLRPRGMKRRGTHLRSGIGSMIQISSIYLIALVDSDSLIQKWRELQISSWFILAFHPKWTSDVAVKAIQPTCPSKNLHLMASQISI